MRDLVDRVLPLRYQSAARYWYRRAQGKLERALPRFIELARPGSVVVDVGANMGVYSYALARRGCQVEAFEPIPECAARVRAIPGGKVQVHEVALSDRFARMTLHIPCRNGRLYTAEASARALPGVCRTLDVPARTLDSFDLGAVSAMKIDVEGHEFQVLVGARETIRRCRPVLLIELEAKHETDVRGVAAFVESYGYSASLVAPRASNVFFLPD